MCDNGSTDRTVEIAESFDNCKVYEGPTWDGDFSKQKNFALSHTTSEWILSVDTDEFATISFQTNCRNYIDELSDAIKGVNFKMAQLVNDESHILDNSKSSWDGFMAHPRLYRRSGASWEGKVHERLCFYGKPWNEVIKVIDWDIFALVHYNLLMKKRLREKAIYAEYTRKSPCIDAMKLSDKEILDRHIKDKNIISLPSNVRWNKYEHNL